MPAQKLDIDEFLKLSKDYAVFDVRSPGEYQHAHIPGAISLPLFSDEERKVVGTAYKQQGRQHAIKIGLDYFGPRMRRMVEQVEEIISKRYSRDLPTDKTILIHCWRGGMRSGAVAWLLDLYGFKVYTLTGGYKRFRNFALGVFEKPFEFSIIGGYTGSGKTYLLHELKKRGEIIIDLEQLANHKGSAFGAFGLPPQPSQEMFENLLAVSLMQANQAIMNKNMSTIWLEDESQRIGTINIPQPVWHRMRNCPLIFIDIPFAQRLAHIVTEYGKADVERMINAIVRIKKRLGGLETKTAINALVEGDIRGGFEVLLKYYDKYYQRGLHNRESLEALLTRVHAESVNAHANASIILKLKQVQPNE